MKPSGSDAQLRAPACFIDVWRKAKPLALFCCKLSRDLLLSVRPLTGPLVLSIASAFVVIYPNQSLEVFRAIAQDLAFLDQDSDPLSDFREIGFSIVAAFVMCITLWYISRSLSLKFNTVGNSAFALARHSVKWSPLVVAVLPLLALAYAFVRAKMPDAAIKSAKNAINSWVIDYYSSLSDVGRQAIADYYSAHLDKIAANLWIISTILFGIALLLIVSVTLMERAEVVRSAEEDRFLGAERFYAYAFVATWAFLFIIFPVRLPQFVGVLCIFFVFMTLLVIVVGQLSFWSQKHRFPFITVILVCFTLIDLIGIADNHALRKASGGSFKSAHAAGPVKLEDALVKWYESRPDRQYYIDSHRKYPVYIVAAEGGGMYAAYHTAQFLGLLQDRCKNFSDHLFAVSAVSGGSVGASLFAAVMSQMDGAQFDAIRSTPCPAREGRSGVEAKHELDFVADRVFGRDFLAPLIGGFLFSETVQRAIPYPISVLDRSRALEASFEDAWGNTLDDLKKQVPEVWTGKVNILSEPYLAHWRPDGRSPALLLNATEVGTGDRRLISPFIFASDRIKYFPIWDPQVLGENDPKHIEWNIPLSTAVFASARFPWVTPAAWFVEKSIDSNVNDRTVQLVDGGYFDNSGVSTAMELLEALRLSGTKGGLKDQIDLKLIVLSFSTEPTETASRAIGLTAPIRALLAARVAAGRATVDAALSGFARVGRDESAGKDVEANIFRVDVDSVGYALPLGWRLSQMTRLLMSSQSSAQPLCDKDERQAIISRSPVCVANQISQELGSGARK